MILIFDGCIFRSLPIGVDANANYFIRLESTKSRGPEVLGFWVGKNKLYYPYVHRVKLVQLNVGKINCRLLSEPTQNYVTQFWTIFDSPHPYRHAF